MRMDFEKYMELSHRTVDPNKSRDERISEYSLSLLEEIGELSGALKKIFYHGHDFDSKKTLIIKEMGDLYWYLTQYLIEIKISDKSKDYISSQINIHMDLYYPDLCLKSEKSIRSCLIEFAKGACELVQYHDSRKKAPLNEDYILMIMFEILLRINSLIGIKADEVFETNIEKLIERYPEGFSEIKSINRVEEHHEQN